MWMLFTGPFWGDPPEPAALVGWENNVLRPFWLQVINGFISSTEFQSQLPELCAPPSITVSVSPSSATVERSATQQFSVAVSGTSNTEVVWTVNWIAGGTTGFGTISANGLYTAPPNAVPFPGFVSIIATSVVDPTIVGAAYVLIPGSFRRVP